MRRTLLKEPEKDETARVATVHISNEGINDDSNCGVDEIFLYGGFQLTF